jgi:hypothetical protein
MQIFPDQGRVMEDRKKFSALPNCGEESFQFDQFDRSVWVIGLDD